MTEATTLPLRNPRTGLSDGELPITSAAEVAALGAGLRQAQLDWAERSIEERCARLNALADALVARRDGLLDALLAGPGIMAEQNGNTMQVDGVVDGDDEPILPDIHAIDSPLPHPVIPSLGLW